MRAEEARHNASAAASRHIKQLTAMIAKLSKKGDTSVYCNVKNEYIRDQIAAHFRELGYKVDFSFVSGGNFLSVENPYGIHIKW